MSESICRTGSSFRGLLALVLAAGFSVSLGGCGLTATLVAVGLSGSSSGGGRGGLTIRSVGLIDVDDDGIVGADDRVVVQFTGDLEIVGVPLADDVFVLDPPGSFGATAVVSPGATGNDVEILLTYGASLEPNGDHGIHAGATGIDNDPVQTGLANDKGKPARPRSSPPEL